jgi:plasmid stabilization system protein ParE
MGFQIVWTDPAAASLQSIVEYIASNDHSAARRFADAIIGRVELASTMPRAGALFARRRGLEIREVYHGAYRIFYRVRPRLNRVEVLVIWHSARQEPKLPRR